jgi:adhesin transport system outer membrane protein
MRVLNPITSALLLALASANVQAMSITEAVQSAVDYHPQVSSSRNSKLSADEDVKFARGGYYPSVDLVAGYGRQRSDNTTTRAEGNHNKETLNYTQSELRLRQMIFDGFNTANEVGRTEAVSPPAPTTPRPPPRMWPCVPSRSTSKCSSAANW